MTDSPVGHWIQLCPTNLDRNYDSRPSGDYRCHICGQEGDHYVLCCPKNTDEESLTKQRERSKTTETPELQAPTEGHDRQYRDRLSSAKWSQNHSRSRSPDRGSMYRRSADLYRPDYGPIARDEENARRSRQGEEFDISPYSARARLTQEPTRFEHWPSALPPLNFGFNRAKKKENRSWHREPGNVTKRGDEGRLAYDDDIYVPVLSPSSPLSPSANCQPSTSMVSSSKDEVLGCVSSSVIVAPDDVDIARGKADEFLQALAAEFSFQDETVPRSITSNDNGIGIYPDDSSCSNVTVEHESPGPQVAPRSEDERVDNPRFGPEVMSLFENRDFPIIHKRASRKTASQMMQVSDGFFTHCTEEVDELAIDHPTSPPRLLTACGEDGVQMELTLRPGQAATS